MLKLVLCAQTTQTMQYVVMSAGEGRHRSSEVVTRNILFLSLISSRKKVNPQKKTLRIGSPTGELAAPNPFCDVKGGSEA